MKSKIISSSRSLLLALPLLALALGGCSLFSSNTNRGVMDPPSEESGLANPIARLHVGDSVIITFSGLPEDLPVQEKPIKEDGTITLPDIGRVKASGKTPGELEEILTIATRVPDHGKFAPWRLVIFEGDARAAAGARLAAIAKARRPDIDEASLEIERKQFLPAPLTVGVLLSPRPNPKAPEMEQLLSAGNVCFNLEHAAFALGFAATWHTRWYAFDPEAQARTGTGTGLRNVRDRVTTHYGTQAIFDARAEGDTFTIRMAWPYEAAADGKAAGAGAR